MTAIDDLPPLRDVIRRHDLSARKSLGQNFLLDLNLTARIARAAGPLEDATIVEIGPGPGGLTRALLASGARRVIAIERDERALAALEEISKRYPGRLEIVCADAQAFDPRPLLGGVKAKIVANLPYNMTKPTDGWACSQTGAPRPKSCSIFLRRRSCRSPRSPPRWCAWCLAMHPKPATARRWSRSPRQHSASAGRCCGKA
jgi:16S rRNA (adenine1518-N6/adenine1519-N6)-dimethyltransferase